MSAIIWITLPKPGRTPSRHRRKEYFWNYSVEVAPEPRARRVNIRFRGAGTCGSDRWPAHHPVDAGLSLPSKDAAQLAQALLLACNREITLRIPPNGTRKLTTLYKRTFAEELVSKNVVAVTFKAARSKNSGTV